MITKSEVQNKHTSGQDEDRQLKLAKLRKKVKTQQTWQNKRLTFGTTDRMKQPTTISYSRNAIWTYHGNQPYYAHSKWEGKRAEYDNK